MDKRRLREKMKLLRDAISEEERRRGSEAIAESLLAEHWYETADAVLVYAAIRSEVELSAFCERAHRDGKRLYFPKVRGERMEFYQVDNERQLVPGAFGVREPWIPKEKEEVGRADGSPSEKRETVGKPDGRIPAGPLWTDTGASDNGRPPILVPGLAFSRAGARLGYGKGYYDRFLRAHPGLFPVGICFEAQLVEELPVEEFDCPVERLVTERGSYSV